MFVAPFPWGNPPTADFLQNIVSSVIRQGLVPGFESPADMNIQNIINVENSGQIHVQQLDGHFHVPFAAAQLRQAPDGASEQTFPIPTSQRREFTIYAIISRIIL